MKAKAIVLPGLALGAAVMLIGPSQESLATFSLTGSSLPTGQRDVRLFNNYTDPESNNNTANTGMFPFWDAAEQATWKGIVEWGSEPHGTGGGDPTQVRVGSGGANFDPSWQGNASGIGGTNDNIISSIFSCSGSTIAFAELPSTNGWRIRMCDNSWTFSDGPGTIGSGQFDIQAITAHEYGHCVGLSHSCESSATMFPSASLGSIKERSIDPDDVAGVQAIYGVASPSKPVVCQTACSGGSVTIRGRNFSESNNDVWFTNSAVTATGVDPRVRLFGVPSTNGGTEITVAIPAAAAPGDLLVKVPGGSGGVGLSNAFPINLTGTITNNGLCSFAVSTVTPSAIESLIPGTLQTVAIGGSQMDTVTSVAITGHGVLPTSSWTAINEGTIKIDMPQLPSLGAHTFEVSTGASTQMIGFTLVAPATPRYQLGTGDDFNVIPDGSMMDVLVAGPVGTTQRLYYSNSSEPSIHPAAEFMMGNNFSDINFATAVVIGAAGYTEFSVPISYGGGSPLVFYNQSIDISTPPSPMFNVSNLQIITVTP